VFLERTSLGLDVHARSVRAAAIDTLTGEVIERTVSPRTEQVVAFVGELAGVHGPVLVTYEAGPTGYGLARALAAAGHRCQVAAPSKLLRPAGDRVKTDARDAMLLARLARNDDIVAVTIPSVAQESARDLVRAREDTRMTLMSARHRLSKLLLRHGHVYDGGEAWTGKHDAWLRRIRKEELIGGGAGTLAAFDDSYDAVVHTLARRDRLDVAIRALAADSEFTAVTRRLGCLRGISTTTGFALAVEIGDWHRLTGASIGSYLGLVPSESSSGGSRVPGRDHQDPQQPRPPAADRGRLAPQSPLHARQDDARPVGAGPSHGRGPRRCRQPPPAPPLAGPDRPQEATHRRQHRHRPRARRLVLVAGRDGRLTHQARSRATKLVSG